jgi:hypothetical protein
MSGQQTVSTSTVADSDDNIIPRYKKIINGKEIELEPTKAEIAEAAAQGLRFAPPTRKSRSSSRSRRLMHA